MCIDPTTWRLIGRLSRRHQRVSGFSGVFEEMVYVGFQRAKPEIDALASGARGLHPRALPEPYVNLGLAPVWWTLS